jgi:hypothetical protein
MVMKDLNHLIKKYKSKGIIIDTNLLLLLIVGQYDKNFIPQHRRLEKYEIIDFEWLINFIKHFKKIIITPHILTELSNLSFTMSEPKLSDYIKRFVFILKSFTEENLSLSNILSLDLLPELGVTDSAFIDIAKNKNYLVITDDLNAYVNMEKQKIDAINYTYVKDYIWNNC